MLTPAIRATPVLLRVPLSSEQACFVLRSPSKANRMLIICRSPNVKKTAGCGLHTEIRADRLAFSRVGAVLTESVFWKSNLFAAAIIFPKPQAASAGLLGNCGSGNIIDIGHAIDYRKPALGIIIADQRRGLPCGPGGLIGLKAGADRFGIVVRAPLDGLIRICRKRLALSASDSHQ